ncbi:MAG TPA: two-component regulator propeller domain-containing protein [Chitinophagales bacterium]|nr:two-component regulator propeller domain-containing protein [Chitinophagales bacterium]
MRCSAFLVFFIIGIKSTTAQWVIYNTANSLLPDNSIYAIEADSAGNIWVGTDNGLAKFDGNAWTVLDSSNSGLPVNQVRSIAFDAANRLWVGTLQAGLAVYDGLAWTGFNTANSLLPDNQVRCISFDNADSAWLGTSGGVTYLGDEGWVTYNQFNSPLGANNVTRIFIDAQNTKWIGTINGGIGKKSGNNWTIYNTGNSGLTDNTVLDFATDIYGNIWFATPAHGLGRFDGTNWFYRITANSDIPSNSISCIEIALNADVKYLGSADKGLIRWNNGLEFDSFTINNSPIPDNRISCLKITDDGKLWIGTATGGLAVFNDTTVFSSVGIKKPDLNSTIWVYPNPVTDKITINTDDNSAYSIEISNMLGELVIAQHSHGAPVTLQTVELPYGLYVLHIYKKDYHFTAKFLKQ